MSGPIRVLVVDDQALVREGLMTLLEAAPDITPVAAAADGEEAVALCARHRPDVVLMDLRMPKLDGVEATRRIRAAQPDTEIVVLTTHADEESILDALQRRRPRLPDQGRRHRRDLPRRPRRRRPPGAARPGGPQPPDRRRERRPRGPRRRPASLPDELTPREAEVLSLIAARAVERARSPRRWSSARRRSRPTSTTCSPRSARATARRPCTTPTRTGSPADPRKHRRRPAATGSPRAARRNDV